MSTYHRPATIEEALALLGADGASALAGGTVLNALDRLSAGDFVDLQDVAPSSIEKDGERVTIGAMTRLQDLVDGVDLPQILREVARREAPSTLRNAATVGGTVATADPDSELLAAFLVFGADVTLATTDGVRTIPLRDVLENGVPRGSVITSISMSTTGDVAAARTGRTPADVPIVAAVGRRNGDKLLLALTGVATTPRLVDQGELEAFGPPADFRGSAEYRRHLAVVLVRRVVDDLGGAA
jgi:CO/xanthine dehydrogenase FAD-binding subunit